MHPHLFLVATVATLLLLASIPVSASQFWSRPARGIMPWMCLERCPNTTEADIVLQVSALAKHQPSIYAVAFERFNLGVNGTLILNANLTKVAPLLRFSGFTTLAMISSWPYPKDFVVWMRQLFANPYPFINNLTQVLMDENIDGVNIDFEPTVGVTAEDAANYAIFLENLRINLAQNNKTVTVDVARWTALWNYTAISNAMSVGAPATPWGAVATMSTYVRNETIFLREALYAANNVNGNVLVVGIEAVSGMKDAELTYRLKTLQELGVTRVGIWKVPFPDTWWPIIHSFVNGTL